MNLHRLPVLRQHEQIRAGLISLLLPKTWLHSPRRNALLIPVPVAYRRDSPGNVLKPDWTRVDQRFGGEAFLLERPQSAGQFGEDEGYEPQCCEACHRKGMGVVKEVKEVKDCTKS